MIDTHSHLLAGLDDGAQNMEETTALLELAVKEQITGIIATPHAFHPNFRTDLEALKIQLELARNYIDKQGLDINIYSGQECRLTEELPDLLEQGKALTMVGSRYVLLELPSYGVPAYTVPIIQQLIARNYVPVIAHVERNQGIIENPDRLNRLLLHGAMGQVTAGSLSGHFGKAIQKTAFELIEANLVHVYGSDAHSVDMRPYHFNAGLNALEKKKLHEFIDIFLENNNRILLNESLHVLEPQIVEKGKWWKIFS